MMAAELLTLLISISEKAADLARAVRSEHALFQLLVEEKTNEDKNKRFVQDFKTLADVLIQEMVKHDLTAKFSDIKDHIYGEENNSFTNTLGETITVEVQSSKEGTSHLLSQVLDDNKMAADILANVIHQDLEKIEDEKLQTLELEVDISSLAVWIDPIDATSEYIKGISDGVNVNGIYEEGLQCVTVLIGVYDIHSGLPVLGVINQPFLSLDQTTSKWCGRYIWGVAWNGVKLNSYPESHKSHQEKSTDVIAVLSASDKQPVRSAVLSLPHGSVQNGSGAGYKALCVIDKSADIYVLAKNSTFKWDCCAPHAIIRSMGGDMLDLKKAMKLATDEDLSKASILYNKPDVADWSPGQQWANDGGILTYWSEDTARKALKALIHHL